MIQGKKVLAPDELNFPIDYLLFGTSLLGKVGTAIPNTTVIEKIKNDVAAQGLVVRQMEELDAFLFELVAGKDCSIA